MFQVFSTQRFEKELKKILRKYPGFAEDIDKLSVLLSESPEQGSYLGAGLYKVRVLISGKSSGKSYGARVINAVISLKKKVYLLSVYDKSEKKDLSPSEIKELVKLVKSLKE